MKQLRFLFSITSLIIVTACSSLYTEKPTLPSMEPALPIAIPTAGNTWVLNQGSYTSSDLITPEGVRNWNNPNHTLRTFFYLARAGKVSLGIRARVNTGPSTLTFTFNKESREVALAGGSLTDTYIGDFQVPNPGYYFVELRGLAKAGNVYADVQDILLGGISSAETTYLKDDFYFGRRGPSVHLNFPPPAGVNQVEWFYSEITIPQNQDVIGSYFMANGFGEGYFGIQVNSPTERRILFSVWSPYQTDNPASIPPEYKIQLLRKGPGVTTGEFGNEGSGGQSYKVFNWQTDVNYGFLVGAKPTGNGSTDYVAYFYDPLSRSWNLIAQFRRPKTTTYLKHLYSFLENFIPDQGVIARKGLFHNQWVYDTNGWHELTDATFTADDTARKEARYDYSGGLEGSGFYLKNCGFSNDRVRIDSKFARKPLGSAPQINFSSLP